LKDTRKLLADALERLEPVAPNFAYIAFHASCTLKSAHDVSIVAISPSYGPPTGKIRCFSKSDSRQRVMFGSTASQPRSIKLKQGRECPV
jgi:hypothetical protein